MNEDTEANLNKLIVLLEGKVEKLKEGLREAKGEIDIQARLRRSADETWSLPLPWKDKGLPVPRIEMYWDRTDDTGCSTRCTYVLVYRHYLDGCGGKENITANPMGVTSQRGAAKESLVATWGGQEIIELPFRDGAHAHSDAKQLKLPMYLTTEDDDVALVDTTGPSPSHGIRQSLIRKAGSPV